MNSAYYMRVHFQWSLGDHHISSLLGPDHERPPTSRSSVPSPQKDNLHPCLDLQDWRAFRTSSASLTQATSESGPMEIKVHKNLTMKIRLFLFGCSSVAFEPVARRLEGIEQVRRALNTSAWVHLDLLEHHHHRIDRSKRLAQDASDAARSCK